VHHANFLRLDDALVVDECPYPLLLVPGAGNSFTTCENKSPRTNPNDMYLSDGDMDMRDDDVCEEGVLQASF
jgi:hypothetical protein